VDERLVRTGHRCLFRRAAQSLRLHRQNRDRLTWTATVMGLTGLLVRWRESYLLGADIGHIPVSNLYEVFILFALITALLYLFYEDRHRTRAMGGFALLVISGAVAFLLWYTFDREAQHIQPLIPGAAELLDEDPCAGQLHRLRRLCPGGDARGGLSAAIRRRGASGWLAGASIAARWSCWTM
jgi:hypothetical protein